MTSCFLPLKMCGRSVILEMTPSPLILSHQSFPTMLEKIKNKTVRRQGHWGALGTSLRRVTPPRLLARSPKGTRDWRPQLRGQSFPFPVPKGEEENRGRETGRASRPREGRKPRGLALWGPGAGTQAPVAVWKPAFRDHTPGFPGVLLTYTSREWEA